MDQQLTQPNDQNQPQVNTMPNTETKPVEPTSTPASPPTPVTQAPLNPTPPQTSNSSTRKNRKILISALGVMFLIMIIAGSAFYVTGVLNRAKRSTSTPQTQKNAQIPTPQIQLSEKSAEETEAESVDTGDPTSDITELEYESSSL